MLEQLENLLRSGALAVESQLTSSRSLQYVALPGSVEGGACSLLAFVDGTDLPAFMVKVFRSSSGATFARTEAAVLSTIAARGLLGGSVPSIMLIQDTTEPVFLIESYLAGRPMVGAFERSGLPRPRDAKRNFDLVSALLANLATTRDASDRSSLVSRSRGYLEDFLALFGPPMPEQRYLADLAAQVNAISAPGPGVQHGDLTRHNVLVRTDAGIGLVDWTGASVGGAPLHDLLTFLVTYSVHGRTQTGVVGIAGMFERAFYGVGPYTELLGAVIVDHVAGAGLDPELSEALLAMMLVERAVDEHARIVAGALRGGFSRGTIAAAHELGLDRAQVGRAQVWPALLKVMAGRHGHLAERSASRSRGLRRQAIS